MAPTAPAEAERRALIERLRDAIELLESIADDRSVLAGVAEDERTRLLQAVARVYHPDRAERRRIAKAAFRQRKADRVKETEDARSETGIRALRRKPVFHTPNIFPTPGFAPEDMHEASGAESPAGEATEPQHCYVCKRKYTVIHHFYDQLCPDCAELNFRKRTELADLRGRVALVTGGRVKIGYQAVLKLLRCGAHVIVTTRFPRDSAQRFAREEDFEQWSDRLEVFGLDLRHTPSVEAFCRHLLDTRTRLDFIVNNACQTVRRPPEFYRHMMDKETAALPSMPEHVRRLVGAYEGLRGYHMLPEAGHEAPRERAPHDTAGITHAAQLSQIPLLAEELVAQKDVFPEGR